MVIRRDDRVATVIGQDASLIDVFTSLSPAFERLRNPAMRKVMARLVTVEQAARMAGIDATLLVERLNSHLAEGGAHAAQTDAPASHDAAGVRSARHGGNAKDERPAPTSPDASDPAAPSEPPALARIPATQRNELDVRAELRAGREPFSLIMAALRDRVPGGAFAVRAVFEPVPLYAVMAKQGLAHHTERLADNDWRVWFYPAQDAAERPGASDAAAPPASADAAAPTGDAGVVVLDVRDLEPPEPMMRTLAALEQLPAGGTLVQLNVRVPQFLLPLLEERGFEYEIREQEPGLVRVFIRHRPA